MTDTRYWFRCPNGHLGTIDYAQLSGSVSIICDGENGTCDFHGYVGAGEALDPVEG